jgi:acyl-coenzyme A synthetase/AMP-(fatty) acid ligase
VLIQLLRDGAQAVPDQPVVVTPDRSVSYSACLARSEELARGLWERSWSRFACQVGDRAELLALLCASTAVGAEACVYPECAETVRIDELAMRFDHRIVVTDRELALDAAEAVSIDAITGDGPLPPVPACMPTMILTTGTTGVPKGVRHDLVRLARARRRVEHPGVRWLLAYNLNQFAGIQMVLHALATKATLVTSSGQPRDSVRAMMRHGVTHASATPTFWRVVTSLLDEQTAASIPLQQITLGGEAIPDHLLADLRRLFPAAKISQVYAASEFGSSVSVRDGRNGLPASVLERDDNAPVRMKVVDGELYARSRVGMLGYYGEADIDETEWRPTGDLVEVRDDRIYFVGRSSDIINVGGVKVHPLPVEDLVSALEGVELARAYGRANAITGQIVAVDVVARPGTDHEQLDDAIRAACQVLAPAARPRRIRFVDEIGVTEHKISRRRVSDA